MANYVITCVIKSDNPASSAFDSRGCHITDVGFGGAQTMTVKEVYAAMDSGDTFQTVSPAAAVHPDNCRCGTPTLKTHADGVPNNNLDFLPSCR